MLEAKWPNCWYVRLNLEIGRLLLISHRSASQKSLTLLLPESNLESINVDVPFNFVDETLVCDHSNKSCRAVLSCGTVCFGQFFQNEIQDFFLSFDLSTLVGVKGLN